MERLREVTTPAGEQETPNHEQGLELEEEEEEERFQLSKRPLGSDSTEDFLNCSNILVTSSSGVLLSENTSTK